ncbi:MAG: sodium/proton-translocating pyrophosphatase, partial [Candidatus Margulisiibacteriota bacterium]
IIKASTVLAGASIAALTWPALIMGLIPLVVGYALGIKWLCGVVFGTLLAGFVQGYYWSNVGDTLHNVRHHIASGHYGGPHSATYRNALVADSIGDGFKDLLSPSVNIIMKSVAMIAFLIILLIGV